MLAEILGDSAVGAVAARYDVEIGAIHSLQEAACSHAACIAEYLGVCRLWGMHAMCCSVLQRLRSGGVTELHPLTEIRSCTVQRARALLAAGIKTSRGEGGRRSSVECAGERVRSSASRYRGCHCAACCIFDWAGSQVVAEAGERLA